jgi:hypothetical protein
MNNVKPSQFTVTRRDIPSARRLVEGRASALRPEDRPSGVRRTAPLQGEAPQDEEQQPENETTKSE